MKVNTPISGKECKFGQDENLITITCPKGIITYYNDVFRKISGFDHDDLMGKNHNVVRHPDMPAPAFEDLWQTIKNKKSWMGIVKNRCKNGDHYYVDAYVTPIVEDGVIVEYQSVRKVPGPNCTDRAEKIYKRIREGKTPFRSWLQFGFVARITAGISMMLLACLGFLLAVDKMSLMQASIALVAGLGVAYGMARLIAAPLLKLEMKARAIYDNDLACMIYEGSLNEASRLNLALHVRELEVNSVIARLDDSSGKLKNIVSQTSEITGQTREGNSVQKSELEQLSTAMNEMSTTVQEVASNTAIAATSAQQAEEQVSIGKQEVSSTINVIKEVSQEVNQAASVVRELQVESESIGAVLDVIRGVAEQTNLLALNAAIEAARAGEQGRGFAVVADEVRSLASRTQKSTQEIHQMIESIQKGARDAVSVMESGCGRVDDSVLQAEKTGVSLESIANVVGSITDMNTQIAAATEEQSSVSEEINRNVENIHSVSEQNAALSTQSLTTIKELTQFSDHMHSLILQFHKK